MDSDRAKGWGRVDLYVNQGSAGESDLTIAIRISSRRTEVVRLSR